MKTTMAMGAVFLLVGLAGSRPARGVELPKTAAGECAAAYLGAFNSGSKEALRSFVTRYRSSPYLQSHPVGERVAHHERLVGIFGRLHPVRLVHDLEHQLTLLADAAKSDGALVIRFQLDPEAPHSLSFITFSGIDSFDVTDEYANYVATRAAPIDGELRRRRIRSLAEVLGGQYVYPRVGKQMVESLLKNESQSLYDDLAKAGKLADKLTEDAVAISKDRHVWVEAQNPVAQASSDPVNRDRSELRGEKYGFREVRVLPGNIGYIKFDMIFDDAEAQQVAASALAFVARGEALVLDLRDNIGGEWGTAGLVLGYLLPGGTVLSHIYDRDGRLVEERSVPRTIPGVPFASDLPVYVLTSSKTGSAAEALAYSLASLGRATVVGEVTIGMAHPSKEVVVNDSFRVSVPFLRSENVVTGADWEGVGVTPQIKAAAEEALDAAVRDARKRGN